ncbi:MAG: flavin reductase family protein [Blastocatellia bacterium]
MPVSSDDFRAALSRFASGVTVVTTKDGGGKLHGITVSAFCSVSLYPPLVLVCIEKNAGSHYAIQESGIFAVNILSAEQSEVSEHFALILDNKFEGIDLVEGNLEIPILPESLVTLECSLTQTLDGGDHSIFLARVENVIIHDAEPLVYFRGDYCSISK